MKLSEVSLGSRIRYHSYKRWEQDLPKKHTLVKDGVAIVRALSRTKEFEGVAGLWNHLERQGWIYAHYLDRAMAEAVDDEPSRKTKTKTKGPEVNLNRSEDFPDVHKSSREPSRDPKLSTASQSSTADKLKNVKLDNQSMAYLLSLALNMPEEEFGAVEEIEFTKPKPNLLPKVISTAMLAAGQQNPDFHAVKNLPGYMSSAIRQIGKAVFAPFTSTPIADIQVVANLNGSGPNTEQELNAVANFVKKHGTAQPGLEHQMELVFDDVMPGYKADVFVRTFANYTFMVVQDHAGKYVYAWPSTDNKKPVVDKSIDKLLKHLH